jgi:spore coat protein U-like protein
MMFRTLMRIAGVAGLGLLLSASPARAEGCVVNATAIAFGSYNVYATAPVDSTGTITYECTGGGKTPIQIGLMPASGNSPALQSGAERLAYNLYLNAARTAVWGIGSNGTQYFTGERSKTPVSVPVFARVPAQQDVAVGNYSDTVTVIINF